MDFKLTNNLDLSVIDKEYQLQEDGETTLLQAFFTDSRVNDQRGYWIDDIITSNIWQYDQKRSTSNTIIDLDEESKRIAKLLVDKKVYEKIETNVTSENDILTLQIKCFDKKGIVVNRKFAV